jgi:hypothetical protein
VVAVAQLVESRIVIPVVVGSSPISHPKEYAVNEKVTRFKLVAFLFFGKMNSDFWKIIYMNSPLAYLTVGLVGPSDCC